MTAVPQEIYDEIIDHLHDNKAELATCALVCRAWIPSSRHHLFSVIPITIDEKREGWAGAQRTDIEPHLRCAVRFLDLLALSEYILPSIREVRIYFKGPGQSLEKHCLTDVLTILRDAAPRYQSVSFGYRNYSPLNLPELLPLCQLTDFSLRYAYNRQDFALCAAMPCLQKLVIDATGPWKPVGAFIKESMILPRLRSLAFYGPETEILRSLAPPPLLRDLTIGVAQNTDMLRVGAFLQPSAPNIECLRLDSFGSAIDDDTMQQLGLRRMTQLRSLIIRIDTAESTLERSVPATLDNVTSCEVDHIVFFLDLWGSFTGEHWTGIPTILGRPNFRSLRKLEFRLFGSINVVTETEAGIIRQLQGLEARHILHIIRAEIYE